MNVSNKDYVAKTDQPLKVHPQINAEVSINSLTNLSAKTLAKDEPVNEKQKHEWGEVVVLVGTSTAGKSSIISELIKQKPNMIERAIDSAWVNIPLNYLNKNHSKELTFLKSMIEPTKEDLENSSYVLTYIEHPDKEPIFKTGISENAKKHYQEVVKSLFDSLCVGIPGESREEYEQSIISCMMDEIILEAKQGRPIACDILQVNEVALEALKIQLPSVKLALVFVPFQTLAERVITRNKEAVLDNNLGNARPGIFPLEQFAKLLRPRRDNDLESEIVQKLTFGEVKHSIDSVFENSKSFLESYNPESLEQLQKDTVLSRSLILAKLGFEEGDDLNKVVELTPSYKGYHMLINTAQGEKSKTEATQDAVKQILVKK